MRRASQEQARGRHVLWPCKLANQPLCRKQRVCQLPTLLHKLRCRAAARPPSVRTSGGRVQALAAVGVGREVLGVAHRGVEAAAHLRQRREKCAVCSGAAAAVMSELAGARQGCSARAGSCSTTTREAESHRHAPGTSLRRWPTEALRQTCRAMAHCVVGSASRPAAAHAGKASRLALEPRLLCLHSACPAVNRAHLIHHKQSCMLQVRAHLACASSLPSGASRPARCIKSSSGKAARHASAHCWRQGQGQG